jgi:hypothetical protein
MAHRPLPANATPHFAPRVHIWNVLDCAWNDAARYCFRFRKFLSAREADFVGNLVHWKQKKGPSGKQLDCSTLSPDAWMRRHCEDANALAASSVKCSLYVAVTETDPLVISRRTGFCVHGSDEQIFGVKEQILGP